MQRDKDVDLAEDAAGVKGGGFAEKCNVLMGLGWRMTKKLAVAGAAISSAPMVLPPLFIVSTLSLIFSIPSTAFLAWYAATNKLMHFLLPPPPAPLLLGWNAAESVITDEEEYKEVEEQGGELEEEAGVILIPDHHTEVPHEAEAQSLEGAGMGYDFPLQGGGEVDHLPDDVTVDSSAVYTTDDLAVPELVEKGEGENALRGAGGSYYALVERRKLEYLPDEVAAADSIPFDYSGDLIVPEQLGEWEGKEAPQGISEGFDFPVKGGEEIGYQPAAEATSYNYVDVLAAAEQMETREEEEVPEKAGGGYDVPVDVDTDHLPVEATVGHDAFDYADRLAELDQETKWEGETTTALSEGPGMDYYYSADGETAHPPAEVSLDSAALDYTALPEEVEKADGASGMYVVPVEGDKIPGKAEVDSAALDYIGDKALPEQVKKGEWEEAPSGEGGEMGCIPAEEAADSVAFDYSGTVPVPVPVPEQVEKGEGAQELMGTGEGFHISVEVNGKMGHSHAADSSTFVDYAGDFAVAEQVKKGEGEGVTDTAGGRYDVPVGGAIDTGYLPADATADNTAFNYTDDLAAAKPEATAGEEVAVGDGRQDKDAEQISQLQLPLEAPGTQSAGGGAIVIAVPGTHVGENNQAGCDQESVLLPAFQEETSVDKNVEIDTKVEFSPVVATDVAGAEKKEIVAGPIESQARTENDLGKESPAEIESAPPPVASGVMDSGATEPVSATPEVEGLLVEVPVVMTSAVVGTNAAVVVQQEVTPTVVPLTAAGAPAAKKDLEPPLNEETMWEQIEALRMIIGYTVARQASLVEELKSLYLFTGVEPPISYEPSSNLMELGNHLQFLKTVVGVI